MAPVVVEVEQRTARPRNRHLRHMRRGLGPVAACVAILVAAPLGAARVEIVLDASGSMRGAAGGTTKMEAAKEAVRATVGAIDASSNVALRLYGHRLPSEPKEPSCRDTELVIPFGPLDRERFVAAVEAAQPLGQTPLAHSLEQAAADFGDLGDETAAVILVSDGEESCDGDPAAVACAFAERGLELTIHTVGFDVDAAARQQLQEIARCTGGEYRDAKDAGELAESLRQLTQAGLLIDKEREALGQETRGGDGFESAVPITPGTYRLDHHQRPTEYDYFAIEVTPGHLLRVTQEAYEVGVRIQGDTFSEGGPLVGHSTAGVAIHGPDRKRISKSGMVINPGGQASAWTAVTSGEGGSYYILVGVDQNVAGGIHKDSPITIEIVDQTDAGSTDAGPTYREAVPIELGEHLAWLQAGDEGDIFSFSADPAMTYDLRARPEHAKTVLALTVRDEDGVDLDRSKAPNEGAAVRLEGLKVEREGPVFVSVGDQFTSALSQRSYHDAVTSYTLELTAAGAETPAETAATDTEETPAEAVDEAEGDAEGGGCLGAIVLTLLAPLAILVTAVPLRRRHRR